MDVGDGDAIIDEAIVLDDEWTYRDDLFLFLGRNPEPFLRYYDRSQKTWRPVSFCWPALLVPLAWFMYRRMHAVTAAVLLLGVALGAVLPPERLLFTHTIPLVFAVLGKSHYLQMAQRKIAKAERRATDEDDRQERIVRSGGVSVVGAVVGSFVTAMPVFFVLAGQL